jgi:hypothetical protein
MANDCHVGGGKPPGMAVQVSLPEGLMHARCCLVLKRSRSVSVGMKMILVAVSRPSPLPQAHRMKSPVWSAADVM